VSHTETRSQFLLRLKFWNHDLLFESSVNVSQALRSKPVLQSYLFIYMEVTVVVSDGIGERYGWFSSDLTGTSNKWCKQTANTNVHLDAWTQATALHRLSSSPSFSSNV
jgi:hypothetical protein